MRAMDQSERPRPTARGCLANAVGEVVVVAALGLAAVLLVLLARALDALLQQNLVAGLAVVGVAVAYYIYGLVWTVRIKPGLYLENLKNDPVRQARLGADHVRSRKAGMIYLQIMSLLPVGYGMTLLIWSRP